MTVAIDVVNMVTSLADPADPEFIRKTMYLQDLADELVERNEKRKEAVEKDLIEAENIIRKKTLMNNNPLIVYSPNFWEGTIGILAGKLAEKYQVPCLVFTKSSAKGIAKGSGRTYGNIHLKYLLDKASDLLVGYGGHAAAAGMSIKITNISILQHRLKSYLKTEAVDGLDNVYKVTNKDGTTEYKQYVRNDDDTYCFVPVDEKGNPLDLKNDASTISKNYVHADGNIYALYNKDNVKMGYRERVKNNDGSYSWKVADPPKTSKIAGNGSGLVTKKNQNTSSGSSNNSSSFRC